MTNMNAVIRKLIEIEQMIRISSKNVLDTAECALYLGISASRLRHLASAKEIPYYKRAGKLYFSKSEIDDWKLSERVPTNEEIKLIANNLY